MVSWIPKIFSIGHQTCIIILTGIICLMRDIRIIKMKLVGQARQYCANVEKLMTLRRQEPIQTWDEMKLKLQEKYFSVSYKQHLINGDV